MNRPPTGKRIRERLALKIPARVQCREAPDFEWVEITRLINVSPFGAGFTLKRPTERGRLLHMTMAMPRSLRTFDHAEDQYRVWGLVRYVRSLESSDRKSTLFEVGVAFVGKHPPRSYQADPARRYETTRSSIDPLVLLDTSSKSLAPAASADLRAETRHVIAVDMLLEITNENGDVIANENTVTEEISRTGATILTSLDIPRGRFIRLTSQQYNVTMHAAVRSQKTEPNGISRIHVAFIGKEWPL